MVKTNLLTNWLTKKEKKILFMDAADIRVTGLTKETNTHNPELCQNSICRLEVVSCDTRLIKFTNKQKKACAYESQGACPDENFATALWETCLVNAPLLSLGSVHLPHHKSLDAEGSEWLKQQHHVQCESLQLQLHKLLACLQCCCE